MVFVSNKLVQELQARQGQVFAYPNYKSDCPLFDQVEKAEAIAKTEKLGIWAGNPIPPWEFRRNNK